MAPLESGDLNANSAASTLMRVQVNLRVHQRTSKLLDTVGRAVLGQLVGEILCVVIRQLHHRFT
jgi:hypothetical protein